MADKPPRILVIDDNPTNVAVLRKPLATSGHEVHTAAGGFEGIRLARELQPDLILLDIAMPRLDGIEVCKLLKSHSATAAIPVLFVTAHTDGERVTRAFAAGGCDFITKPIKVNEVLARVSVHLRLRKAECELIHKNEQLQELTQRLLETNSLLALQSRIDPLTRLLNRGAWSESARTEHERTLRSGRGYAIVMIDVDHFKSLNDSLGHAAGDDCLRRVASCANAVWRNIDLVGRYGGEEFVVLMPETSVHGALQAAERFRDALAELAIPHPAGDVAPHVTVSMGVAASMSVDTSAASSLEEVIKRADAALYDAKQRGRDRVCGADGAPADGPAELSGDRMAGRLMLVDADAVSRTLCGGALRRAGYTVHETGDGAAALGEVRRRAPDIILVASSPDGQDAARLTKTLKGGSCKGTPAIILLAEGQAARTGLEAGADELVTPPTRVDDLLIRVRSMMRVSRGRKALAESLRARHALQQRVEEQATELGALRERFEQCAFDRDCFERRACESERMISTLLGNLQGAAYRCRCDAHRTMEFLSDGCGRLLGWDATDLIDNRRVAYADLIHPDDAARVRDAVGAGLAERRPFEVEYRVRSAGEEDRRVREVGCGVFDDAGELIAVEGIITDAVPDSAQSVGDARPEPASPRSRGQTNGR